MVKLGREMTSPVWFQSLGTVLAFDWNASGLTTILTAALKEAIRGQERHFGVFIWVVKERLQGKLEGVEFKHHPLKKTKH